MDTNGLALLCTSLSLLPPFLSLSQAGPVVVRLVACFHGLHVGICGLDIDRESHDQVSGYY